MDTTVLRQLGVDGDLDQDRGGSSTPGKSSLTSRLAPAPQVIFRVTDPETARALGESLSGGTGVRIQREAARDGNGVAAHAEAAVERAASSSGSALPTTLQRRFEESTGADLSSVRVHTGADSEVAAHAVGARAYTVGQDIHFGAGQYQPDDPFGMHLLAHEVAHTVQQSGGAAHRQHKLEVSAPHDAAEVEADRAADAMVTGAPVLISGASAEAHRKVLLRGPGDPPAKDPAADKDKDKDKDAKISLDWWVDWQNKETGSPVQNKSNARTGKDSATGTLKVIPEAGAGDATTTKWVNAASSGAVQVTKNTQAKDKGGTVSTDIATGKPPSASATVKVIETPSDKAKVGTSKLPSQQKAASAAAQAKLESELQLKGDVAAIQAAVQAAAKAAVTDGADYAYDVTVTVSSGAASDGGNPRAVPGGSYSGAAADARRTVSIVVPTEVQKLKGSASVETNEATKHEEAEQKSKHDANSKKEEEGKETANETTVSTEVEAITKSAWESMKKKLTTTSLEAEGGMSGNISGSVGGAASLSDLEIDFGTLIGALTAAELGPVSLIIAKAIGKGKIGGSYKAEIGGKLEGFMKGKSAWTKEDLDQTISKLETQVTTKIKTSVTNSVKTKFSTIKSEEHSKDEASQKKDNKDQSKKVASSVETIGVKYIVGEPTMTVKDG